MSTSASIWVHFREHQEFLYVTRGVFGFTNQTKQLLKDMPLFLSSHLLMQASLSSSKNNISPISLPRCNASFCAPFYPSFSISLNKMSQIAKQGGLLAVDCVVICCCCPCLVLQVTVFLFIRLPCKLAVKSKRILLKKLYKISRKRKHGHYINSNNNFVVVRRNDNECYWMEFDDPPEGSNSLQSEMQDIPAMCRSGRVFFLGSEDRNVEMGAWIAQDMQFVFGERNTLLGDEEAWRDILERGTFLFGSFWANGDYLGNTPKFIEASQWRRGEERDETEICSPRF